MRKKSVRLSHSYYVKRLFERVLRCRIRLGRAPQSLSAHLLYKYPELYFAAVYGCPGSLTYERAKLEGFLSDAVESVGGQVTVRRAQDDGGKTVRRTKLYL